MSWVRFTLAGLVYALIIEFEYKLFARFNPQALIVTAVFYLFFLQYLYLLHRLTTRLINKALFIFFWRHCQGYISWNGLWWAIPHRATQMPAKLACSFFIAATRLWQSSMHKKKDLLKQSVDEQTATFSSLYWRPCPAC